MLLNFIPFRVIKINVMIDSFLKVHMNADITFVSSVENWCSSIAVSFRTNRFVIHVFVYAYGHLKASLVGFQV